MPNELKQVLQDGEVLYAEYLHQLIDKTVDLANSKISEERLSAELTNISNTLKSYASTTAVTEAISKAINEHVATADSQYAKKTDIPELPELPDFPANINENDFLVGSGPNALTIKTPAEVLTLIGGVTMTEVFAAVEATINDAIGDAIGGAY